MNKIKATYERPTTDLLVIRFEQNLLNISGGDAGKAGQNLTQGNSWTFDDED